MKRKAEVRTGTANFVSLKAAANYPLGTQFTFGDDTYILARVTKKHVNLININTGARWTNNGIGSDCVSYRESIGYVDASDLERLVGKFDFERFQEVPKD